MQSFQRGFFCSDLTIRYPYHDDTINVTTLLLSMLLLPSLFITAIEIVRLRQKYQLRRFINNLAYNWGSFSFGFITTYLSTELAKIVIRRLRPHFYAACQPRFLDGSSCEDSNNRLRYVEQYLCSNRNLSVRQLRELYVSFPSAHSSLSFYAMVFVAFYLDAVWRQRRGLCRIFKHLIQFIFLAVAWFISLTRIADHWHHWSDVLAGCIIGILYATLAALYVGRLTHFNTQRYGNCKINRESLVGSQHQTSKTRNELIKRTLLQHANASSSTSPALQSQINKASSNGSNAAGIGIGKESSVILST